MLGLKLPSEINTQMNSIFKSYNPTEQLLKYCMDFRKEFSSFKHFTIGTSVITKNSAYNFQRYALFSGGRKFITYSK